MRVLFISKELIGADLAYRMKCEGSDVKLYIETPTDRDCFDGMVEKVAHWESELEWVGTEGLIVFDDVGYGAIQDDLRAQGYSVLGGSKVGDRLEIDREYGQQILREMGLNVSPLFKTLHFSFEDAIAYINEHKGSWVIKNGGHNTSLTYISCLADGSDALSMLVRYRDIYGTDQTFSIQKKVAGVELAIGRFFNGTDWVGPIVINREHKHFCNDDIGPLGGETGTLMWYEENEENRLFQETLAKMKPFLQQCNYRGYIDLNCIISDEHTVYPLELTSRFGSSTNQLQSEIHESPWSEFLYALAKGESYNLKFKRGYGINVALTTPPFPYRLTTDEHSQKGVPIFFTETLTQAEMNSIHFEDVAMKQGSEGQYFYIAGNSGYVLYITGVGDSIESARNWVYSIINKIHIPKMFYRTDIGLPFQKKDIELLSRWNWI